MPKGIVPTARAEALAAPLAAGLALLEQSLLAPPRFDPRTTSRRFRIAASDYVEFLVLPRFLGALASEAPRIEVWCAHFQMMRSARYNAATWT